MMRYFYEPPRKERHCISLHGEEMAKFEEQIILWCSGVQSIDWRALTAKRVKNFGVERYVISFSSKILAEKFIQEFNMIGVEND